MPAASDRAAELGRSRRAADKRDEIAAFHFQCSQCFPMEE
jgi:hypothetical protein